MASNPHILIIDARFYEDIADALLEGASQAIENAGGTYDLVSVPGVLEIPAALSIAIEASKRGNTHYDGYVTLGCVIRGETSHYDIVSNESARAIMDISVNENVAVGNGIQTVENSEQAWARAKATEKNKGGGAAAAALAMVSLKKKFNL